MYSVFWGVLGLVWVKDIYPVVSRKLERVPKKLGRSLTVIFTVFMAANIIFSAGAVYRQYERVNGIPAENPVQSFYDRAYPDQVMKIIYPHMQYVGRPQPTKKLMAEPKLPSP